MRRSPATLALALLVACKGDGEIDRSPTGSPEAAGTAPVELPGAAPGSSGAGSAATDPWAGLAELPRVAPARVITIPTRPTLPRFTVGGPVVRRDIAVVASSQFGFAAVDWRRGTLAWTKPAGIKVAPPIVHGEHFALVGDCVSPPTVPDGEMLLGCLRVVTIDGTDQAYLAIHGATARVEPFAGAAGEQLVWSDGDFVRWRRGDQIVRVHVVSGVATPIEVTASAEPRAPRGDRPPIVVAYGKRRWEIEHVDGRVVAFERGKRAWAARTEVNALLGAVWLPGQGPMVRMVKIGGFAGTSEVRILDMDATGSMNGTASWTPVPGISLLGTAIGPVGDAVLAVRLDTSIKRDFIAAYAASALLVYVFPLPEVLRADPVGLAIALDDAGHSEAVVAFYDGDQVAILPDVSAPPTAPGATTGPLENATP